MRTSELTDAALDWAVAKCMGQENCWMHDYKLGYPVSISTDWAQGGPIIEREELATSKTPGGLWYAYFPDGTRWIPRSQEGKEVFNWSGRQSGPTPLIAAMRCYVGSKLGNEVDVPEELT